MFKLLKDLTRAPEPLSPRPSISDRGAPGTSSHPYTPRQPRGRSPAPASGRASTSTTPIVHQHPVFEIKVEKEVEETDGYAKIVVLLLHKLEEDAGVMHYVETLSQLNGLPKTRHSLGSFRRHRGFEILTDVLEHGLAWKEMREANDEERQVQEVQRWEGVRIAFETLGWALTERENRSFFEKNGGYLSLLDALRLLSPVPPSTQDPSSSRLSPSFHAPTEVHPTVLAHLMAHIFNDNYTILSVVPKLVKAESDLSEADLRQQLGELSLRRAEALPLLWAYIWGLDEDFSFNKGKSRADESRSRDPWDGSLEKSLDHGVLAITLSALSIAAQTSHANLFAICQNLPDLPHFLLTRLYGPPKQRKYETTFPPRDDWCDDLPAEGYQMPWQAPEERLRSVYLGLLRRLLDGGVDQEIVWRLFNLVKTSPGSDTEPSTRHTSEAVTPALEGAEGFPPGEPLLATTNRSSAKKRPKPGLHISTSTRPPDEERLEPEVLELIRQCMRSRWPSSFCLRGGSAGQEGGIELADIGRAWPPAPKGFNFSCWLYVSKLNRPITIFDASQANQRQPLFRIRILENSQIALLSTTSRPTSEVKPDDPLVEEVICSAPDALVPHHQWVHFAVGCRKPKGAEHGEVRIFVNGVRVGAMRLPYPVPIPLSTNTLLHKATIPTEAIRLSIAKDWQAENAKVEQSIGKEEENEWLLGRVLMMEEAPPEDLVLLLHRLGPRYTGNLQEPLGKFLTYEGATSINIYISSLAQGASDKRLYMSQNNSLLVRAIRQGSAIQEENIVLSLSAKDCEGLNKCYNGAVPHPIRAKQLRNGMTTLCGDIRSHTAAALDESVSCVGGGIVMLKLIDLSSSSEELAVTLGMLRDMIRDSWTASEEMERIRGFEMLAAILRPKMGLMVDVACAKIILSMLGINMDRPSTATVHNSAAYRAVGLEFELWSYATPEVISLYLQHFAHLLSTSKHARYNVLRTFQKAAMVRKMLYALRSGFFDAEVVPLVVDTLRLALLARWSGEDSIKPVFSYLVSALCQGFTPLPGVSTTEPPASQAPAAQILTMIAELASDAARLVKLTKSLALHRLLIIFISSNSAYYVIVPCLDILEKCLTTPGLESFQRSFETEGGFALLARSLGPVWRDDIQGYIFRSMLGPSDDKKDTLHCQALVSTVLAALEHLLQASSEDDARPTPLRTRSGTITSIRSVALTPIATELKDDIDSGSRVENLLKELDSNYRSNQAFRRCFTGRKVEQLVPALTDFAAVSASSNRPEKAMQQRLAAASWLQAIVGEAKVSNTLQTQLKLILEQLQTAPASPKLSSASFALSPNSPRPATSYFGSSLSGRLGTTPPTSPMLGTSLGMTGRRRPSTVAADAAVTGIGMGLRRMSAIDTRIPLKRTVTGESILEGGRDKNAAWKLIIIQTDSQAHSKMTLERKEHWQKLSEVEWPKLASILRAENGLWPDIESGPVTWRLDGSEGPLRMRNRLERIHGAPELGAQRTRHQLRDAIPSVDELSSAVSRLNTAPWEDPFALALGEAAPIPEEESPLAPQTQTQTQSQSQIQTQTPPTESVDANDDDSYIEVEENKDDKMRRIAKTLEAGDVVEQAHNIVRIVGVDACPGLLIFGKKNLYLVDGLVQTTGGEVIDAKDAPRDVLSVPGTLADLEGDEQESHRWPYSEIVENNKRAFLFRDVALELYFSDKRNFLIVFKDKRERQSVVTKLSNKSDSTSSISKSIVGNFVLDQVARAVDRSEQQLEAITRKWQHREISNFAYLQLLNQHANRTPNDVTQYPVFPWVLADYTSHTLDLDKISSFRDLTWPMGALTPARKEAAVERYSATEGVGEQPFHYGTHYSSSMIVCGFMIRMSPFTEIFLALQGGNFDLADRLFSSIPRAWDSACADNRGDVRELIPEFFYSPSFLLNVNHHDFGRKQVTGDSVDNVVLPPWALEDPLLFIHRHREALESEFVSRHLHTWIDLTFGYKQRDPASFNCFHPLSYRGAVDLENISDESEKAASTAIIHNFGQTPVQVFKMPHCHRIPGGRSSLPVGQRFGIAEQWQLLIRSILPITETATPIHAIIPPPNSEMKPSTQIKQRIVVPNTQLSVQYGFMDDSLRVYYQDSPVSLPRLVHLVEGLSIEHAIFATPTLLITVSSQGVITAWKMTIKSGGYKRGDVSLRREGTLRGHDAKVTSVTANTSWSLLVTGSEDGEAKVWDTNRLRYIRTLQTPHREPLVFSAINESDGHIALASRFHLYMFSLNGHPIASVTPHGDLLADFTFGLPETPMDDTPELEYTGGIAFLRRDFLRFGPLLVIGVNNSVALYRCIPGTRRFEDEQVKSWKLVEQGKLNRSADHQYGDCCMVRFIGETLYAAYEPAHTGGKWAMFQWSLPDGDARHVPETISHTCMAPGCSRHFGLLEPKRYCGGCGGAFCGTHAVHVESFNGRYCEDCRAQLAEAQAMGVIANRKDSAYPQSRRTSVVGLSSAPGSRRPSLGGSRPGSRSASRTPSRTPSRSVSRAGSRRPSISMAPATSTVPAPSPLAPKLP